MDRTDSEIILLLQQNARISMSEISSRVNLSVSAVSERLKKLEQSGLVSRYTTILNSAAFQKTLRLFIDMEIRSLDDLPGAETYILKEPDILEYHKLAGGSHALLKIVTADITSLDQIISHLKEFPCIGNLHVELITVSPKAEPSIQPVL